ncbi:hypothetical protein F4809DRAFT_25844 [Biscogniauxia mediterranea]|nr:hypothetical protein F4809DRAFT_25844 [Biscogniauxia mediterranea]
MPTTHRSEPASLQCRRMYALQQRLLTRPRYNSCSPPSSSPPPRPLAQICTSSWFHSRCRHYIDDNDDDDNQHHNESRSPSSPTRAHHPQSSFPPLPRGEDGSSSSGESSSNDAPPMARLHQPIGFVCCQCRYRSSGSYCSNPDRPDCPHRGCPRCGDCPILFTPPRRSAAGSGTGSGSGGGELVV